MAGGTSMKSLGGLVMTWIWWAIIVEAVLVKTSLGYKTLSFDLGDAEEYSIVVQSLRIVLAKGTVVCQFPVTSQSIADDLRFVLVDLTTSSKKTVKVAIDVTDVYVVGYQDKLDGKDRAVFLKDVPSVATRDLFPGVTTRITLPFDGTYGGLQANAGVARENLDLGVNNLGFAIEAIQGKALNNRNIARFFLIAIQMMSEAARFIYIQNEVVNNGLYGSFKPNAKVLNLENNWGAISEAIHKSSPQCTNINPALQLRTPSNELWVVDEVNEIRPDLGVLKFKSSKLT